ncbi:MAG: lysylphosphatidylglycerol synthase transmembrane domain-containing protein [Acidobacteriota bacterium]
MNSKLKNYAIWFFSILLAVLLFYHFAYKANWKEVYSELKNANLYFVALAVMGEILFILTRVLRWKILLLPLEKKLSIFNLLKATVVSFAVSGVAPAKLGEIARPVLLSRWEGVPITTTAASVILERGLDLIAIVTFWFIFILFGTSDVSSDADVYIAMLNKISIIIFAASFLGVIFLLWFAKNKKQFQENAEKSVFLSKSPILGKIVKHFFVFADGLLSFRKKRMIFFLIFVSLLAWGFVSLTCYFAPRAVGIELPWGSAFLILSLVSIGASIPTPGGVGGVHKAIYIALVVFYGLNEETAVSAAILGHAMMFLPAIVWGALYLIFGRVKFQEVSHLK